MVRNSILIYDVIEKVKNIFSENTGKWHISRRRLSPWIVVCGLFWFISIQNFKSMT